MNPKIPLLFLVFTLQVHSSDWPTYRHDNRRSGVTTEQLQAQLKEAWTYKSPAPPQHFHGQIGYGERGGFILLNDFSSFFPSTPNHQQGDEHGSQ